MPKLPGKQQRFVSGLFAVITNVHHPRQPHSKWLLLETSCAEMAWVLLTLGESAELCEAIQCFLEVR